ncbi:nuclear pore complex protein An-Nup82 [Aspergillus heteromorphus CBS 117.55]|uniref:Nuclear pore complex protein An-Nup82 n=1 Tax=Aspergillus heteromorphus CBS 117.55 TaxID=1448321 RepID=A0A317V8U4_9EURO|nr:nuclear pore complex protein An-Nup82 [Aspergillus heteromorphus CBS 117.55]PWY70475.1 nuclear pore complex protein An-Nup82 [Aspergillus heteromorphus CBS 117.55]
MPKVISYTPPWLSRPAPGASVFASSGAKAPESLKGLKESVYSGPTRIQAKRGNELFTVVDNQIRWSDLTRLKNEWQHKSKARNGSTDQKELTGDQGVHYRVLVVPVYEKIRQLIPSPNGAFLAIVADHTVFIAVLPDPAHLAGTDDTPIRTKSYQLGPTTHVIPESSVVSALWHPLGVHNNLGGCFVTVTADAAVRVWELDRNNHWSFDRPTLAVDLRKLVDGTSSDQDFAPSGFGKNKGFSADFIDMEVASACFGGTGTEKEEAWAPMTLWVAMRPGDLYALCPLLPTKWRAPSTTVPSLSAAIIPKLAALEEDPVEFEEQLTACRQQYDWLAEIDNQEPLLTDFDSESSSGSEVLTRPANPSAIPRLQGPFRFDTGDEIDDLDLCDLLVIGAKVDLDALMMGEEDELALDDGGDDRLSATVICLATGSGRIHVCLELDGVEGQWLPKAKKNVFSTPISEPSDLVLVESLDTMRGERQSSNNWPTFTKDVYSRYGFFVTNSSNVTFISLASWVQRLEAELQSEDTTGTAFRLQILCEGAASLRERILEVEGSDAGAKDLTGHLPASLIYYDYDLGYLLLTYQSSTPHAAILDAPEVSLPEIDDMRLYDHDGQAPGSPVLPPRRPPYQVPSIFYAEPPLEFFVDKHVPHRQRQAFKEQVRLSPATLDLVAAAHRILSAHTNALERAASDLFRRCERLQGEMRDQLKQLAEVAERVKGVSSEIGEDGKRIEGSKSGEVLDKRLQAAKDKQAQLVQRYETLRNKVLKSGGRPLSDKEKSWVVEVKTMSDSIGDSTPEDGQLTHRLDAVREIADDLLTEVKTIAAKSPLASEPGTPSPSGQPRVPQRLQRAKIADAMQMVERESAIIDNITSRLERLNTNL